MGTLTAEQVEALENRLSAFVYKFFPSLKENDERLERERELEKEEDTENIILRSPKENLKVAAKISAAIAVLLIIAYGISVAGPSSQLELIKDQAMRGLFSITYTPQWNIWLVWVVIVMMVLNELSELYDTEHVQKGQKALDVTKNIVSIPYVMAFHDAFVFLVLLENPITPVSINYLWWGQFPFTFNFILETIF
tara:strand:- start:10 stop:594 length:585 start_codon:yes stop_codon:yes gene_type:complete